MNGPVNDCASDASVQPPEDVRSVWLALDELGASAQRSAPSGLEDRILARTPFVNEQPTVIARIGGLSWALKLAASLALIATIGGAAWLASQHSSTTGSTTGPRIADSSHGGQATGAATGGKLASSHLLAQVNADLDEWISASTSDSDLAALNTRLVNIQSSAFGASTGDESLEPSL